MDSINTIDSTPLTTDPYEIRDHNYVSSFGTVMNLLNSILGAGVLSISNSFTFCGLIPSIFIMTVVAGLSYVSAAIVVRLQMETHVESLDALSKLTTGRVGSVILSISSMIFCYSCMIAYLIMGTDFLISWLDAAGLKITGFWDRALVAFLFSVCIPVAMSVPKKMKILSYISTSAIESLAFFTIVMIVEGIIRLPRDGFSPTVETYQLNFGIFNALAIYSLSFALAVVIIPIIIHSKPDLTSRYRIAGTAFFFSYVIVMIPGAIGYLIFGQEVEQIILLSFDKHDTLFIIVKAAYFIVLSASYPVLGLTVLTTVSRAVFKIDDPAELPWGKRSIALFLENLFPVLVAMFLPNVRFAMSIGGSLGGGLSNFVFPPIFSIVLSKKRWFHWTNILCMLMSTFGIVASAIATYESVLDAIAGFKGN
ncbi:Transmembrane amino acid transporter protein [Tritrichomonas foetus]|uniref:Transmembrane amino acid transporter protein n=1 Tax=Tritrichomonas foetus TaxID=1144522 RepID=A0A1J4JLJ0_9EUKA|nr:Transmembrane amino acid transporter protein [Tritrichomonas foetus]|eukprot:OHS99976.1 Transmembrane amino acid transporter protein [Tritrichomonas foetus]